MRPGDIPLYNEIKVKLNTYKAIRPLSGINNPQNEDCFILQIIDSVRRVKYVKLISETADNPITANPNSLAFDPLKAAIWHRNQGNINEAFWLVFLATHFGKNSRTKWNLVKDVYSGLTNDVVWNWENICLNTNDFLVWLDANHDVLKSRGKVGNHRKYQSLGAYNNSGTGNAITSYINWIGANHEHQELIDITLQVTENDSKRAFRYLYYSMNAVMSFGRMAKFDFLTMIGKLGLIDIEPDSTYMTGATGPVIGARILFDRNVNNNPLGAIIFCKINGKNVGKDTEIQYLVALKHTNIMTNIGKNYFRFLEVLRSLIDEPKDRPGVGRAKKMSDLEVVALSLVAEFMSIDSENSLFKLIDAGEIPNLIERSQFNKRRKKLSSYTEEIRLKLATPFLEFEDYFIVDSMPLEICKMIRHNGIKICKEEFETAPSKGYCASQDYWFYGYKLHGVCSVSGVFHSLCITKAAVHDIHFLKNIKYQMSDCVLIADKGYLSETIQLDLFETVNIKLETPKRKNQKDYKPQPSIFKKKRKRIETLFSQLCDQFRIRNNYAKSFEGFKTRILSKITALTLIQYINKFIYDRPINNIKNQII